MGLWRKEPFGQTPEKTSSLSTDLDCYISIATDFCKKSETSITWEDILGTGHPACRQRGRRRGALEVARHTLCCGKFYCFKSGIYIDSKLKQIAAMQTY